MVRAETYSEVRDAISHDWIHWLNSHGWTPVLVPNALDRPADYLREMAPDLLILTGGNDSVPGTSPSSDFEPARNRAEFSMLQFASDTALPVLGVCRGMHLVNQFFDGGVHPDVPDSSPGHVARDHPVAFSGPVGEALGNTRATTNSFHNQIVLPDEIGQGLMPFATCEEDGVVEGLAHEQLPILGVQWHPERSNPAAEIDDAIVSRLVGEGPFWAKP